MMDNVLIIQKMIHSQHIPNWEYRNEIFTKIDHFNLFSGLNIIRGF